MLPVVNYVTLNELTASIMRATMAQYYDVCFMAEGSWVQILLRAIWLLPLERRLKLAI